METAKKAKNDIKEMLGFWDYIDRGFEALDEKTLATLRNEAPVDIDPIYVKKIKEYVREKAGC